MTLSIIVAVDRNMAIGQDGNQPFFIKEDLKHFKKLTTGHPVIMGRRTFEALPNGALPNRRNIVITRDDNFCPAGTERASSPNEAIRLIADADEAFIIGGGSIYRLMMPMADRLYVTEIDAEAEEADTFFPMIDPMQWELTKTSLTNVDPATSLPYRFTVYNRKHHKPE